MKVRIFVYPKPKPSRGEGGKLPIPREIFNPTRQGETPRNAVFPGVFGGRNRTRTCDPIDVNDVLSAPATFVQEEDEFPIRLQSRSYKGFHGICTQVQLHLPDRAFFHLHPGA